MPSELILVVDDHCNLKLITVTKQHWIVDVLRYFDLKDPARFTARIKAVLRRPRG